MLMSLNIISALLLSVYAFLLVRELIRRQREGNHRIYQLSGVFLMGHLGVNIISVLLGISGMMGYPGGVMMSLAGISTTVGVMLLTAIFDYLEKIFHQAWLYIIYYIGIFFTGFTSYIMSDASQYYSNLEALVVGSGLICILIIFSSIPFLIIGAVIDGIRGRSERTYHYKPYRKGDKTQYYRERGLNDQEIIYFREQMALAKNRIETIEREMGKVAKLRLIETRHNTVDVSKEFFRDIVSEPERMAQAGLFLNKLLPSLEDLSLKYNEIAQHVAKTKQTYLILEKSAATIDKVCESISDQYITFHQAVYNDLDDEIKLANKYVPVQETDLASGDLVDDLINAPFNFEEE